MDTTTIKASVIHGHHRRRGHKRSSGTAKLWSNHLLRHQLLLLLLLGCSYCRHIKHQLLLLQ